MVDRPRLLAVFYRLAFRVLRAYWFVFRPTKRGVKCVLTRGNEVLLVRHTYGDRQLWELPGGAIKRGEAPLDAARRETREELGLTISDWRELGHFTAREEHRHDTLYCFGAEANGAVPVPDRVEIAEARWFPAGAPPAPIGRFARYMLGLCAQTA